MEAHYYIMPAAAEFLNKKLRLPALGQEQDWDIEFADSSRVQEFLTFYQQEKLSSAEKVALMALIVASYDDWANENLPENEFWQKIETEIRHQPRLFKPLVCYWAHLDSSEFVANVKLKALRQELYDESY